MSTTLEDITSKLWAMANELRGNMDASEYKNYILAFMFYRYLSEHQMEYLEKNDVLDIRDGQTIDEAYAEQAVGEDMSDYLEDISAYLGYAIEPQDTWASLIGKIDGNRIVPSDYQAIFDDFEKYASLNKEAARDFRGVFSDVNLGDSRLGANTNDRAKSLNRIVKLIDGVEFRDEHGRDVLGGIYEYLIGMFAANAGKKGGEFYTPHEVSQVLARLVTNGVSADDGTFSVYDPACGSGSLLLTVQDELPGGERPGIVKFFGQELNTTGLRTFSWRL
ncbi:N-6 DNA methylase, partial [Bifidobacterium minimum]